jgi:DNA-binding FadR family transcriptional regulator
VKAGKSGAAIEAIKGMILSGELRPGDRLPREDDLAGLLGISRNSLREAVRALVSMQILTVKQGDGTYVARLDPAGLMEPVSFAAQAATLERTLQFLEVRRILEPEGAQIAAFNRSDRDLAELKKTHAAILAEYDVEKLIELDSIFHGQIAAISGNAVLRALVNAVASPTVASRILRGRSDGAAILVLRNEHQAILDAIVRRDGGAARHLMAFHLIGVENWVRGTAASSGSGDLGHETAPRRP